MKNPETKKSRFKLQKTKSPISYHQFEAFKKSRKEKKKANNTIKIIKKTLSYLLESKLSRPISITRKKK